MKLLLTFALLLTLTTSCKKKECWVCTHVRTTVATGETTVTVGDRVCGLSDAELKAYQQSMTKEDTYDPVTGEVVETGGTTCEMRNN